MGFQDLFGLQSIQDLALDFPLHRWIKNFDLHFYKTQRDAKGVQGLMGLTDGQLCIILSIKGGGKEGLAIDLFIPSLIPNFI